MELHFTLTFLAVISSVQETVLSSPLSGRVSVAESESQSFEKQFMSKSSGQDSSFHGELSNPKPKARTPQFIPFLLRKLENMVPVNLPEADEIKLTFRGRTFTKSRDKLFHAWLPIEVAEDAAINQTVVIFQQTQSLREFGDYTSCQIVLTLREDVDDLHFSQTYISMHTHWENDTLQREEIQTQPIKPNKKYFTFSITKFIASSLQQTLKRPNHIKISFQVYSGHNKEHLLDFKRYFDVQVDMPLIVMLYGTFVSRKDVAIKNRKRDRRTVSNETNGIGVTRPTYQCQRYPLEVNLNEMSWKTVIEPKKLDIGYCAGDCQYPLQDSYFNFTLHAFLLDRYKMQATFGMPNNFPHQSSCVPVKYRSHSVLEVLRPDAIDAALIHDIAVESCGCSW